MMGKFRAWHKQDEVMFDVLAIDFMTKDLALRWIVDGEFIEVTKATMDDVVLTQSTGEYDKNEVEIYIGDRILHINEWKNTRTEIYGELILKNATPVIKGLKFYYVDDKPVPDGKEEVTILMYHLKQENLQVIGHVFED